jgi:hypothetical protein
VGNLGDLLLSQGRLEESGATFEGHGSYGDDFLRLFSREPGQPDVALAALDEARQIAEQLSAGPDSDLGQLIAETDQLQFG